ncbi:MAG: [protein-PII] uridylyltransferase [Acidobacteria bacterium]|nr:[protein-PII] uridylyltransferase [Acidobacteriota bacterium]
MLIDLETIRQQAGEGWRSIERQSNPLERLAALKKYLRLETRRLQLRHRYGISGSKIVAARSLIVDLMIQGLARLAVGESRGEAEGRYAIIALGGYGRQELAPQSDIDVMFLHRGKGTAEGAARLSEALLYSLWDTGFTVGHSCRSMSECLEMARGDSTSRNALLDARLLWGSDELFRELARRMEAEIAGGRRTPVLEDLEAERASRHGKFGEVACLQEPDVKESAGGLRDFHSMLWAARVAHGYSNLAEMVSAGLMPEPDARAIGVAYDFILRVRNDLHFFTGRRADLLTLDLQSRVAPNLGYAGTPALRDSEIFMREYYVHARRMQRCSALYFDRAVAQRGRSGWLGRMREAAALRGHPARGETPEPANAHEPVDVAGLMRAYQEGAADGRSLDLAWLEDLRGRMPVINRRFRTSAEVAAAFMDLLRHCGQAGAVLRQMYETGFLGRYLPEFGRITCLVQHDLYHRYTIDEHILLAIESLDALIQSTGRNLERYRQIYRDVLDPATLHLGLLMHDIGKGLGEGHTEKGIVIAGRVCARLGLPHGPTADIAWLVRMHVVMAQTSQRRDLSDQRVIEGFAAQVGTLDHLNMLTLLTYGDLHGVGPGVWNEWKDALLWELHLKTRAVLEPAIDEAGGAGRMVEVLVEQLSGNSGGEEVRTHLALLPDDYARYTSSDDILEHLRLAQTLRKQAAGLSYRFNAQARCTDLHLCARNRRGLFAAVAGTLTAQGINILSVQLHTRADGIAIESFKVRDSDGEPITERSRWEELEREIKRTLGGETDLAAAVARRLRAQVPRRRRGQVAPLPTRITWDNRSSARSTILEIRTGDRLGLAYKIASTLAGLDLDIAFAKVATEKHRALDIFYITDAAGERLADEAIPPVEAAVRLALNDRSSAQEGIK